MFQALTWGRISQGTPIAVTSVSLPQNATGAMPLDQLVIAFPAN
jgi:hypothetical protein